MVLRGFLNIPDEDGVESSAVLPLNRFFTQYLADTRGPSSKISAKELYGMFCKFCEDEDIPSISSKAFGSEMNRLPGVERYRTGSGRGYDLNHEVLRGFLNEPEPYNPDVATGGASRLGELALEMFE